MERQRNLYLGRSITYEIGDSEWDMGVLGLVFDTDFSVQFSWLKSIHSYANRSYPYQSRLTVDAELEKGSSSKDLSEKKNYFWAFL